MIKSATAVKARIKNKASGDSEKAQIMLRIYMMERFLERVSLSQYRDNFVLKGGLLLSSLVGVDMRSTMDVDTTIRSLQLNEEHLCNVLKEIMAINLGDGVRFEIVNSTKIMEGHEYEGVRFMVECFLDKIKQTIKIDVGTGDIITPSAIAYKFPLLVEEREIDIWAYNTETLLAEKLETIVVRAEANTRMRDFYDIHVLMNYDEHIISESILKEAFKATCKKRYSQDMIPRVLDIIDAVHGNSVMRSQWENYCKSNYYVSTLTWDEVCGSVRRLARLAIEDGGKA